MGRPRSDMSAQPIENKALSWGIIRKSACILAEITIRKSHPLEDSCQEAKPLPSTTFDSFFQLRCARHTPPALWPQTHPCFPCCGVGSLCAAPVTHQAQGSLTSRSRARRRPLARSVPQKTLGSLPCPIVYSVQIAWLPHGSNFYRAHGRGVARLHNPVVGQLSRVETGTNQIGWVLSNFSPSLQPQPHCGAALSQKLSWHQRGRGPA
jgi:hypothetical protein